MNGELKSYSALRLSRFTRRKIKQNLIWAFIYNLVTVPLAMFGIFTPIMGGVAMALSSTSVVANSLYLSGTGIKFRRTFNASIALIFELWNSHLKMMLL